jgi:CHAT domain-containing protein
MVFFNAWQSARLRKKEKELASLSRSFAEYFLRSGVEAYLGTFWPVKDESAATFATAVYKNLAEGAALDAAVREARSRLESGPAADSDWANYVLYGDGGFRLISPTK